MAGPVASKATKYGGPSAFTSGSTNKYGGHDDQNDGWKEVAPKKPVGQATAIADYDFGIDNNEETKYELVSHKCAVEVSAARTKANLTQA